MTCVVPPIVASSGLALPGYGAHLAPGDQTSRTIPVIMTGRKCFRRFALRSHGDSLSGLAAPWASPEGGHPDSRLCRLGSPGAGVPRFRGRQVPSRDSETPGRHPGIPASRQPGIPLFPRSRSDEVREQADNVYRIYTRVRFSTQRLLDSMFTYVMVGMVRRGEEVNLDAGRTQRRESGRRAIP